MRLWIQSNTSIGHDPKWAEYHSFEVEHLDSLRSSGTELHIAGVPAMQTDLEYSAYSRFLNTRQLIDCGIQAQEKGYDAFVMIGMGRAGEAELREALTIPVLFSESVAWWYGAWLHGRFGLLGHNKAVYFRRVEQITQAGLFHRLVANDYCDFTLEDVLKGFADSSPIVEGLKQASRRAASDGARLLIPDFNPLNAVLVAAGVSSIHGLPVMDVSGCTLRIAELLVSGRDVSGLRST